MKIKEVCDRTGLTERAVRLYVERGLLSPAAEEKGERTYLDFSESDVETLTAIARLRELEFSLDDIRQMQLFPDRAGRIAFDRRQALVHDARDAEQAAAALRQMERLNAPTLTELAQAARWRPAPAPAPARPKIENTSGRGDSGYAAQAPKSGRWNWGAFFLPVLWGIGNKSYIAFLCFVPLVGFFMPFYLGAKGYELAWKNKWWENEARFLQVQKRWAVWGLAVTLLILALNGFLWYQEARDRARQQTEYQEYLAWEEQNTSGYEIGYDLMAALSEQPVFKTHFPDGWQLPDVGDPCTYWTADYGDGITRYLIGELTVYKPDGTPCAVKVFFNDDRTIQRVEIIEDRGDPLPEATVVEP